jgi:CubicO group peptidase (beta-lactamase class C family)
MMKKVLLTIVLFTSFAGIAQDIRKVADSIRIWRRVPALAYAVFSADSVFQMGAVGYKRLRTKDTVSLYNRYHLGTATASVTSYIAARMVHQGRIKWNTPLLQVFPELRKVSDPAYTNTTLADLLAHRTGFPVFNNYLQLSKFPGYQGDPPEKRRLTVEWLVQQKPVYKDSADKGGFSFSNANTMAAAAMLEKISGKPWETLLIDYVNKPLGISVKIGLPNRLDINQPWGHWVEGGTFNPMGPTHWFGLNPSLGPAADANLTLPDYVKFVQDHLKGLTGEKALLPQKAYELMHYGYPVYSIGWSNIALDNYHISEADGTMGTFYCHVEIIKEKNIAVIVMANSGDALAKGGVLNLAKMIRQMYVTL